METFELEDGDIGFDGQNDIKMVKGGEEQEQTLKELLSTNRGEWYFNAPTGVEYDVMLGEKYTPELEPFVRVAILDALASESRVTGVRDISIEYSAENRRLTIYVTVEMDGELVMTEVEA